MRNIIKKDNPLMFLCLMTAFILATAACSDDTSTDANAWDIAEEGDGSGPGANDPDVSESESDEDAESGEEDAHTEDAGDIVEPFHCDIDGFSPMQFSIVESRGGLFVIIAEDQPQPPDDRLRLELRGAEGGAMQPGTYALDDPNYATCVNCLMMKSLDANNDPITTYMAQSGTLEITVFNPADDYFEATLSDVQLVEVTVGEDGVTKPVSDGASYCIDHLEYHIEI